jgi:hypothetical protein
MLWADVWLQSLLARAMSGCNHCWFVLVLACCTCEVCCLWFILRCCCHPPFATCITFVSNVSTRFTEDLKEVRICFELMSGCNHCCFVLVLARCTCEVCCLWFRRSLNHSICFVFIVLVLGLLVVCIQVASWLFLMLLPPVSSQWYLFWNCWKKYCQYCYCADCVRARGIMTDYCFTSC